MKRLLCCVIASFVLMFAVSAMAEDSSMTNRQILAPASILGSVVGKTVSVYSDSNTYTTLAAYPTLTTVANTTVPTKYKSKSQWLVIQVTMQEYCVSDRISSVVYVGGQAVYPDDNATYAYECYSNGGYETRTRTWFLPPESLGGPVIAPGAEVAVRATSDSGTSIITDRSMIVQAVK